MTRNLKRANVSGFYIFSYYFLINYCLTIFDSDGMLQTLNDKPYLRRDYIMARTRKTYNWYVKRGMTPPSHLKPKATGFVRRTYNWYLKEGLVPPEGLSVPKALRGLSIEKQRAIALNEISVEPLARLENLPVMKQEVESYESYESDEQIDSRIRDRFKVVTHLCEAACAGIVKALIISGPAGVGKSYAITETLKTYDPDGQNSCVNHGHVRGTGLYKLLYQYREEGQVLVFDDADSIFAEEAALNLLKAACDSNSERTCAWRSEKVMIDEDGEQLPPSFEYRGTIIFISNHSFDRLIQTSSKLGPHLKALISRAHYVDMEMTTNREKMIRIRQVVNEKMMIDRGYAPGVADETMKFVDNNIDKLREVSIRMVLKIADLAQVASTKSSNIDWRETARITTCYN